MPLESEYAKVMAGASSQVVIPPTPFHEGGLVVGRQSKPRAFATATRATLGEATGYNQALARGEIGLSRPLHVNRGGRADFITAARDIRGRMWIIVNDVKTSGIGKFPSAKENIPRKWMSEVVDVVDNVDLKDATLEAEIKVAYTQGRLKMRQLNVDYSPKATGANTTGKVKITGWGDFLPANNAADISGRTSRSMTAASSATSNPLIESRFTGVKRQVVQREGRISRGLKKVTVKIRKIAMYEIKIPLGVSRLVIRGLYALGKGLIVGLITDYLIRKIFGIKSIGDQISQAIENYFPEIINKQLNLKKNQEEISYNYKNYPGKRIYLQTIWYYESGYDNTHEKLAGIQLNAVTILEHENFGKRSLNSRLKSDIEGTWKDIAKPESFGRNRVEMSVTTPLILPNDVFGVWLLGKGTLSAFRFWGVMYITCYNDNFKIRGIGICTRKKTLLNESGISYFEELIINIANINHLKNPKNDWLDLEITSKTSNNVLKITLRMENDNNVLRSGGHELYFPNGKKKTYSDIWLRPDKWGEHTFYKNLSFLKRVKNPKDHILKMILAKKLFNKYLIKRKYASNNQFTTWDDS